MSSEYDPVALLAKARAWRVAAETAPVQWHDFYLGIAEHYEADVRRSMELPVVVDPAERSAGPAAMPRTAGMTPDARHQPRPEG
jgi:hypothetical protein